MTSGPVVLMWLSRENAIVHCQRVLGEMNPKEAKLKSKFSLRAIFGGNSVLNNGFQSSVEYNSADNEVKVMFGELVRDSSTKKLDFSASVGDAGMLSIAGNGGKRLVCVDSMTETVFVVITQPLLSAGSAHWLERVMEIVLRTEGYGLVGLRSTRLNVQQARQIAEQLVVVEQDTATSSTWGESEDEVDSTMEQLMRGKVMMMALEKTNAISGFGRLLNHGELKELLDTLSGKDGWNDDDSVTSSTSSTSRISWAAWSACVMATDRPVNNQLLVEMVFDRLFGENQMM
eukprot:TRINITY_DN2138_c0_g1_i1.p1 TRINITY_DN2138_c0_g1~~TRINITY_DN2138_c0_g1_i1.p1  ORF type:complete len:288 (+),score=105.56 TRINITY_DN2138_c0_g1_i1:171-1034(+)